MEPSSLAVGWVATKKKKKKKIGCRKTSVFYYYYCFFEGIGLSYGKRFLERGAC